MADSRHTPGLTTAVCCGCRLQGLAASSACHAEWRPRPALHPALCPAPPPGLPPVQPPGQLRHPCHVLPLWRVLLQCLCRCRRLVAVGFSWAGSAGAALAPPLPLRRLPQSPLGPAGAPACPSLLGAGAPAAVGWASPSLATDAAGMGNTAQV